MEDKKLGTLTDLTKKEYVIWKPNSYRLIFHLKILEKLLYVILFDRLLEIINLGREDLKETAQRKLYELCLEKGDSVPKYSVEKVKTYQGLTYVATCSALGYTSEGLV